MSKKCSIDQIARSLFVVSIIAAFFTYGVFVGKFNLFPYSFLKLAVTGVRSVYSTFLLKQEWYYTEETRINLNVSPDYTQVFPGLNLVTRVADNKQLAVDIIDMNKKNVHHWDIDWFTLWPDAKHIPKKYLPKSKPGTHVHGAVVMENGDLIFNFEHIGLVRIDKKGKVVWRLPYQTHHSIHRHNDGNLWVCGEREITEDTELFPHRKKPFAEYTLLEVSPEGAIINEWSVAKLLADNGLRGMLYLGMLGNSTGVDGDLLHLNDVEPFPTTMKEDFFSQGDILVSLRNINTVFVFNEQSGKIKFICTGWFVRQHDPDFLDGNRFSVFDNNNIAPEQHGQQSRIMIVSARERKLTTFFEGNDKVPFYSQIGGKHQWLPNGNLLITEFTKGRAFEINRRSEVVWQYQNYVEPGIVGIVEEVQRLPPEFNTVFSNTEPEQTAQIH